MGKSLKKEPSVENDTLFCITTKLIADNRNMSSTLRVYVLGTTRWNTWLRHCGTRRKFEGSTPNGVTEIFH
jgi:hypothetical protein